MLKQGDEFRYNHLLLKHFASFRLQKDINLILFSFSAADTVGNRRVKLSFGHGFSPSHNKKLRQHQHLYRTTSTLLT